MRYARITGTGHFMPEKVISNHDLEQMVETTDEWITERTGIKERHVVEGSQTTGDIAYQASLQAIEAADIKANEIELIIVATCTPDM